MSKTVAIVRCNCKHEQQDEMYGQGNRLANAQPSDPKSTDVTVRCTVCGTVHRINKDRLK